MNNKLLSIIAIIFLFAGIFALFITVVNAKGFNLFCSSQNKMTVILKNEANIDLAKTKILEIPQVRITKIQYRDEEWSKMVNKMDLPKMDNPFKNEFTIKIKRNADVDEIYKKIKEMDFVEDVKYISDTASAEKQK